MRSSPAMSALMPISDIDIPAIRAQLRKHPELLLAPSSLFGRHMATFLYRCPTTGHNVQGFVPDNAAVSDERAYETVTCVLCSRVHLVNPKTGHVLGGNSNSKSG